MKHEVGACVSEVMEEDLGPVAGRNRVWEWAGDRDLTGSRSLSVRDRTDGSDEQIPLFLIHRTLNALGRPPSWPVP